MKVRGLSLMLTAALFTAACGDDGEASDGPSESASPSSSDGLLREQDLSNLEPSTTKATNADITIDQPPGLLRSPAQPACG